MDRSPTLRGNINKYEQIARKERADDRLDFAGMTALFQQLGQIGDKALLAQLFHCARFGMRVCLNHVPAAGRIHCAASVWTA